MYKYDLLINKLEPYCKVERKNLYTAEGVIDTTFDKIKYALLEIGDILEEDNLQQTFVAIIKAGFANMNPAIVGVNVEKSKVYIVSYAKEGLINQNTAEKAVQKFLNCLN